MKLTISWVFLIKLNYRAFLEFEKIYLLVKWKGAKYANYLSVIEQLNLFFYSKMKMYSEIAM